MSYAAGAGAELPDLDDRLVEPETRYEMLDGELVYVPPADPPHAEREGQLCALIAAHVAPGFTMFVDMLTRTSLVDEIAPDISVCPPNDPVTGRRRIAEIAFEIIGTQSIGYAARKAGKLVGRGARRVFGIDVRRSRALEWSPALGTWSVLDPDGDIVDPTLVLPLPIGLLIRRASIDNAVVRAMVARGNAVIDELRTDARAEGAAEGRAEGAAEGLAQALLALLDGRGMTSTPAERARITGERDRARLARWIARAVACASVAEMLAEP